ncbi:cytochrome P450 [Mycena galericulata]|nr:cytochrome P450 [Mycena galericulata]
MAQGSAKDSFVSLLLQQGLDERKEVMPNGRPAASMAAPATRQLQRSRHSSSKWHYILRCKQRRKAELDTVVGNQRLPTYADREHLPFVDALSKEVLRYHPIGPMGLPHRAMDDDVHDGYFIPKGSLVLANIWNMAHDPEVYANPMTFNPSRFIASDGHSPEPDPRDIVFGFGRRVCPGKLLGDASVFIACVMTLATFTISKVVRDGVTIEPVEDYQPGTISQPAPFVCSIQPRSAEAIALIS